MTVLNLFSLLYKFAMSSVLTRFQCLCVLPLHMKECLRSSPSYERMSAFFPFIWKNVSAFFPFIWKNVCVLPLHMKECLRSSPSYERMCLMVHTSTFMLSLNAFIKYTSCLSLNVGTNYTFKSTPFYIKVYFLWFLIREFVLSEPLTLCLV
jgi:hypothetical protein